MRSNDLFEYEHEYLQREDGGCDLIVQVVALKTDVPVYFEVVDKNIVLDEIQDDSPMRFCEGYLSRGGGAVALAIGHDGVALGGHKPPPPLLSPEASIVVRDIPAQYRTEELVDRVGAIMRECCKIDKLAKQRSEQRAALERLSEQMSALSEQLKELSDGRVLFLCEYREPLSHQTVPELLRFLHRQNVSVVSVVPHTGHGWMLLTRADKDTAGALNDVFASVQGPAIHKNS